jgi:hypothetical protein
VTVSRSMAKIVGHRTYAHQSSSRPRRAARGLRTCALDFDLFLTHKNVDGTSSTACACGCGQSTRDGRRYLHGHNRRGTGSTEGWVEQGMRFVCVNGKKRPLHRLIMEDKLGRPLRSDEVVRHRDGDLLNNDLANLILVSREEHFELSMAAEVKEPWTEDEKDEAVRLYCAGMTIDEVARALGRSYSATRRLLGRWGVLRTPAATRFLRAHRQSTVRTLLPVS